MLPTEPVASRMRDPGAPSKRRPYVSFCGHCRSNKGLDLDHTMLRDVFPRPRQCDGVLDQLKAKPLRGAPSGRP